MTLQQLEYILAIDKHRHFAKAAEHCGVTQPTLSAMIRKLENELGVSLFDRHVQPVVPTEIGKKIVRQAILIQTQVARVKEIVKEETLSYGGTFRLGVLPTIAPYLLPRFFPQLAAKYPEMDLQVYERKTHEIKADLNKGALDAAIWANEPEEDWILGDTLFYEEFYGYVSPGEKIYKNEIIRSSEITGERLWLLDEGHCFRDQLLRFCRLEAARINQMSYRLDSLETFMRMVENGQGITFIPELAVSQLGEKQKELVRPFAIPRPTRPIVLVRHKGFIRNRLLELLLKEIKLAVPEHMLSLKPIQSLV
ncbi:MAG: hydrogen peroxide-inducible genes activator [Mediterranea sp.]|jgi:LysR family hydrogen peroxide-inducible transcriptional activator|nr:hydrogen peroxide-inducible genes activator [Mediterranea sp.]